MPLLTRKQRILFFLVLVSIALGLIGGMRTANAGNDYKFYPATTCKKFDPSTDRMGYYGGGHIKSWLSNDWLDIACPIIRDLPASNDSVSVTVLTSNPNPQGTISCWLSIRNRYGQDISTKHASPDSNGRINLNGPSNSGANNMYLLGCTLPPGVNGQYPMVYSYQVYEFD